MRRSIFLIVGFLFIGSTSGADGSLTYDRVTLSVSAETEVNNDTAVAELYSERQSEQASEAAAEVNRNITWALETAKQAEHVSVQTAGYYSQPVYREQTAVGWRVRQSIRIESRELARLSELIGVLQERLAIASIAYTVSPGRRAKAEDNLIVRALDSFERRAQLIAKQLGRPGYRIVQLEVVTTGAPVRPVSMQRATLAMQAAEAVPPPALEGGAQTVSVQVNGVVELKLN